MSDPNPERLPMPEIPKPTAADLARDATFTDELIKIAFEVLHHDRNNNDKETIWAIEQLRVRFTAAAERSLAESVPLEEAYAIVRDTIFYSFGKGYGNESVGICRKIKNELRQLAARRRKG